MSDAAVAYVGHVLDLIATDWLHAGTIDWPSFRDRYLALADLASQQASVYDVVDTIIAELDDGHSHFVRPSEARARAAVQLPSLIGEMKEGVAYLDVPWFVRNDQLSAEEFAGRLNSIIAALDKEQPLGWVVDLRRNGGGNMWPMLAGLGPLLGTSPVGFFLVPGTEAIAWSYKDGEASHGGGVLCRAAGRAYALQAASPKTAILIGRKTASAGEAVCIAFKGRPNTRSFGAPTAGQSTANESYELRDRAILALAAALMVDRLGTVYGRQIMPDVALPSALTDRDHDATLAAAVAWLR